jgi:hypothetical protein
LNFGKRWKCSLMDFNFFSSCILFGPFLSQPPCSPCWHILLPFLLNFQFYFPLADHQSLPFSILHLSKYFLPSLLQNEYFLRENPRRHK